MGRKKSKIFPKTQHSRTSDRGARGENPFVVLDSPDDRITRQNGEGVTLVKNDNPDDAEEQDTVP